MYVPKLPASPAAHCCSCANTTPISWSFEWCMRVRILSAAETTEALIRRKACRYAKVVTYRALHTQPSLLYTSAKYRLSRAVLPPETVAARPLPVHTIRPRTERDGRTVTRPGIALCRSPQPAQQLRMNQSSPTYRMPTELFAASRRARQPRICAPPKLTAMPNMY